MVDPVSGSISNESSIAKLQTELSYQNDNNANSFTDGSLWLGGWCTITSVEDETLFGTGDFNGDGKTDIYCHEDGGILGWRFRMARMHLPVEGSGSAIGVLAVKVFWDRAISMETARRIFLAIICFRVIFG